MNGAAPAASTAAATPTLRATVAADGPAIWRLVRESGVLDVNSPYAYTLLLDDFGDTCIVAEGPGEDGDAVPLGFVLGYRPPRRPHVLFVWQVAVAPAARGHGLAGRMLEALTRSPGCRGVTRLEATVTPSNRASRALFRGFARRQRAPVTVSPRYTAEHFPKEHSPGEHSPQEHSPQKHSSKAQGPEDHHEPEELFSIGPFDPHFHDTQDTPT